MKINTNNFWVKLSTSLMTITLLSNLFFIGNINIAFAEESTTSVVDEVYSVVDDVYNDQSVSNGSVVDAVYDGQSGEFVEGDFSVTESVYGLHDEDILESMLMDNQGNILFEGLVEATEGGQKVAVFRDIDSGEYILCTLINGVSAGMENINDDNGDVSHKINSIEITGKINGVEQGQTIEIFWEPENSFDDMTSSLQLTSNGEGTPFTFKTGPGDYNFKVIVENYQDYVSSMQVDANSDLGTIEMVQENNNGDQTSNDGSDPSSDGDQTSNNGSDPSSDGDQTSNNGSDPSSDGDQTSNNGSDPSSGGDQTSNNESGSSGQSGSGGSPSNKNSTTTFPDGEIDKAISNSSNDNVVLETSKSRDDIQISGSQLDSLISAGKTATLNINGVKVSLAPDQFEIASNASLKLSVNEVDKSKATKLIVGTEYGLIDNIYDFNMEIIKNNEVTNELDSFNKGLSITIPVPESYWKENNHSRFEAFYYNEAVNKWEPLNANHKINEHALSFNTNHFSKYAVLEKPAVAFNDIKGHWAEKDIITLASRGFISGYEDGAFKPNVNITRAEFTVILARLLGLGKGEFDGSSFKDIKHEQWYSKGVEQAYKAGLVQGYANGNFKPNDYITREQMAAIIANAMNYVSLPKTEKQTDLEKFLDNDELSTWSKSSVKRVVSAGLIKGITTKKGTNFAPKDLTSRAEATAVLNRLNMNLDTLN